MQRPILPLVVALALVACAAPPPASAPARVLASPSASGPASASAPSLMRVGSHGMIVTGTPADAFLSHIPMFHAPHDVQLVVAGAFAAAPGAVLPPSFSEALFTFVPDRFSLDALRTGALAPAELQGTLFSGNFEAGGKPLPSRVRFVVARVLHEHVLVADAPEAALTYFVFGSAERAFAAHRVARSPGFDEILRVQLGGDVPPDAELRNGVEVRVDGKDEMASRLGLATAPQQARAGRRIFTVKPVAALSCLEGPGFDAACR